MNLGAFRAAQKLALRPRSGSLDLAGWDESGSGWNKNEVAERKVLVLASRRTTAWKKAYVHPLTD